MASGERIRRVVPAAWWRDAAVEVRRLVTASVLLAALGAAIAPTPDRLALAAALAAVGAAAAAVSASRRTSAWPAWLAAALAVCAIAAARLGGSLDVCAAVLLVQTLAAALAPTQRAGWAGAAALAVAALAAAWWHGDGLAPAAPLLAGLAVALALGEVYDRLAQAEARAHMAAPRGEVGQTRVELERARRDLDVLSSQLRREATQRRRAEEQALDALRTRNAFLGVMSHELRTPLSQIIGYSELLLEELQETGGEGAEDVERIHVASLGLLEVIGNILDMSKIEAGKQAVAVEEFSAAELVDNLVHSFGTQARRRGNVIRVRVPDALAPLHTDRTKLRTILGNLLSNACKFTEGGTIRMVVQEVELAGVGHVVFEVSDTGIGIAPEHIERIFAPFVQADPAPTRRHDGSGLGLAISRQFAAMLGGEITVESEPGKGSVFRVQLPRSYVDPRRAGIVVASLAGSIRLPATAVSRA